MNMTYNDWLRLERELAACRVGYTVRFNETEGGIEMEIGIDSINILRTENNVEADTIEEGI